jgi:hypothetical protein
MARSQEKIKSFEKSLIVLPSPIETLSHCPGIVRLGRRYVLFFATLGLHGIMP